MPRLLSAPALPGQAETGRFLEKRIFAKEKNNA